MTAGLGASDRSSAVTAELVRKAALDLFSATGYDGTSMREIAAAVGVKAGSLYSHFPSKEEILWQLVSDATTLLDRVQDEAAAALPDSADAPTRLAVFVRTHTSYHARNCEQALIVNRQIHSLAENRHSEVLRWRDRYEMRLRTILLEGVLSGAFAIPEPRVTSYAILQMGMGVASWFRPDGPLSVTQICDAHEAIAAKMTSPSC